MRKLSHLAWIFAIVLSGLFSASASAAPGPPDRARIEHWASLLPKTPRGMGPTIEDRKAWQAVAAAPIFHNCVEEAEKILAQPIPELTDDLFLDFSRTGNRGRCQKVLGAHLERIAILTLAECVENRGRFLPAIAEAVKTISEEKTWVLPAHDRELENFHGKIVQIDLRAAAVAWDLATARYWLGDRLDPATRRCIDDELQRRVFTPFGDMINTGEPKMHWLTTTNNWNAVCLAGVAGAAMANIESRERRAFFAASAEKYIEYFLSGFTPDGYCSEGLGYWNFGFGHYVMLAETLRQATDGKIDLMERPNVKNIAQYSRRMEIAQGIYPAFADCDLNARPDPQLMGYLNRRFQWGLPTVELKTAKTGNAKRTSLFPLGVLGIHHSTPAAADSLPLRDWFAEAGVLICRPKRINDHALAVAMKSGHNAEHHNHNDVGSFVVALGKSTPLVDPGNEIYTARTFSGKRYQSNVLNSFGHPVPRVAGQLQQSGRKAAAKVLKTEFTDAADTLKLDLSAAYHVPSLKKLERTFVFSRQDNGKLSITDEVEFDAPQNFGTALITFSKWKRLGHNRLQVGEGPDAVIVDVQVTGGDFQIVPEEIHEDLPEGRIPIRLGIELSKPAQHTTIAVEISP
jgi:hypothetical protein